MHTLQIMATTERMLSERFGCLVRLCKARSIANRPYIYRFKVEEGPQELSKGIIVKQIRNLQAHDPEQAAGYPAPAWLLYNDWAGLQFVNQVSPGVSLCPRFYVGDRDKGIIVMEDIKSKISLTSLLLGHNGLGAEEGLVQLAKTLGQLHAHTVGRQAEFDRLRDRLGPRVSTWGWVPPWLRGQVEFVHLLDTIDPTIRRHGFQSYLWMAAVFRKLVELFDITHFQEAEEELKTLMAALREPSPFLAYTHGDPCSDNCLWSDSTVKLVDFENGAFRHALIDGVYGRIHFPTCWCVNRLPEQVMRRMEMTYRKELMKGCPEAADDILFYHAVVEACAYWVLTACQFDSISKLLDRDKQWGNATMRQRLLLHFESFANTTEEFKYLGALGSIFHKIATKLHTLWSTKANDTPLYPAFRGKRR